MEEQHWHLIKTIVDKALTLSGPNKDAYLSTVCRENPEICTEVEELLHAIEASEEKEFMKPLYEDRGRLFADVSAELNRLTPNNELIGKEIGPYRITKQLGSGGMGSVFQAKRIDGAFNHEVAVKLINRGIDSEDTIRRFRLEREILAGLNHPNIARLYDGGVTEDGTPFLIMEYVDGIPIDQYCNDHRLTIDERLKLFANVCTGMQFAHANLVVHRDLKAQNILVTSEGNVKILDFGIAKLLESENNISSLLKTQPGHKFWTPQYAAPEQVKSDTITTATDVYALGVLLHKLLSDSYPLDITDKSLAEVEMMITDRAPTPPSQCILTHSDKHTCASLRGSTVSELAKKLKGDLDALVLKTLRKEPQYRYASVSQLLEDLERYHSGQPLSARTGTLQYRAAKFIRRHKSGLAMAATITLLVIGFSLFYTWRIAEERDQAQLERDKAGQVSAFITSLFRESSPGEINGDTLTVRHALDAGANKIENELKDQPQIQAEMMTVLGEVYHSLGLNKKAEALLEDALERQNQITGDQIEVDKVQTLYLLSSVKLMLKKYIEAESIGRSALAQAEEHIGEVASITQNCRYLLSNILHTIGKQEEGFELMNTWFAVTEKVENDIDSVLADQLINKATFLQISGQVYEAEPLMRKALLLKIAEFGEKHYEVGIALDGLADIVSKMSRLGEAELLREKAVAIYGSVATEGNAYYGTSLRQLGYINEQKGNYFKADSLYRKSIEVLTESFGTSSYQVKNSQRYYGRSLIEQKRFSEAFTQLNETYLFFKQEFGEDYLSTLRAQVDVAVIHIHMNNFSEAEDILKSALEKYNRKYGEESYHAAGARTIYSNLLLKQEKFKEAELLARMSIKALQKNAPPEFDYNLNVAKQQLGVCLAEQKRFHEAEPILIETLQYWSKRRGLNNSVSQGAIKHLISLYEEWGKPEMANPYKEQLALADDS